MPHVEKLGAVVDDQGNVLRIRPFPDRKDTSIPIQLGGYGFIYCLTDDQATTVQVGWSTHDSGATFGP